MKRLVHYLKQFKGTYLTAIALAILSVLASLGIYVILSQMLGHLLANQGPNGLYSKYILAIFLVFLVKEGAMTLAAGMSHKATFKMLASMRRDLMDKFYALPLGVIENYKTGTLVDIVINKIDNTESTLAHIIPEMTANILGPLLLLIYMSIIDWRVTILSLLPLVLGILFLIGPMKRIPKLFPQSIAISQAMKDAVLEYIHGIEVIKSFNQGERSYKKFHDLVTEKAQFYYDWMGQNTADYAVALTLAPMSLLTLLPVGLYFVYNETLTVANFISLLILSFATIQNIIKVVYFSDDLGRIDTICQQITDILDAQELTHPANSALPTSQVVRFKDVHFAYQGEFEVLTGINFTLQAGEVVALVGPSGSGKSTIAKLLAGFWQPSKGSISIGGIDTRNLSLAHMAEQFSYVSQDNFLFDMSIMDNIRCGRKGASDEEVIAVCQQAGIHDFISQLEQGYQTRCGEGGTHLSGGERQRICIARAMLKDSPLIILDEATSYMDPENERQVQAALSRLIKGKTLLMIAHRLKTVTEVDRILLVKDGQIIASGSHEQLLKANKIYQQLYQAAESGDQDA